MILLISASQVARIIGISHWCPFVLLFCFVFLRQGLAMLPCLSFLSAEIAGGHSTWLENLDSKRKVIFNIAK
jgi:hypothetical protein